MPVASKFEVPGPNPQPGTPGTLHLNAPVVVLIAVRRVPIGRGPSIGLPSTKPERLLIAQNGAAGLYGGESREKFGFLPQILSP